MALQHVLANPHRNTTETVFDDDLPEAPRGDTAIEDVADVGSDAGGTRGGGVDDHSKERAIGPKN